MKRDLYVEVSARIVAELERGAAPWVKPWSATPGQNTPQNAVSSRPYSGCNVILLWLARNRGWATPRFLTFKQAMEAGGHVRKGEHGTKVFFVKQLQVKDGDGDDAESRLIPMMREYRPPLVGPLGRRGLINQEVLTLGALLDGFGHPTRLCAATGPLVALLVFVLDGDLA